MNEFEDLIKEEDAYKEAWNKALKDTIKYGDNIQWIDNFGQLHPDYQLGEIWDSDPSSGIMQGGISIVLVGDDGDDVVVLWLREVWDGKTLNFNVVDFKNNILGKVVMK